MPRKRLGVILRSDALSAGYTDRQIRALLASGAWQRIRRSAYVTREAVRVRRDHTDNWHALQAEALVLLTPGAVLSGGSAIRWFGYSHLNDLDNKLQAIWPKSLRKRPRVTSEVDIRCCELPDDQFLTIDGVRVTTPARTAADILRTASIRNAVVIGDHILASGLASRSDIIAVLGSMTGWPGTRQARRLVTYLDARVESPLESLCHLAWRQHDLPAPELQVWVYDHRGFVGIVDGMWLDHFVAYEADGAVKYTSLAKDSTLQDEKERQERAEQAGLMMRRFDWNSVWKTSDASADRIANAFEQAATLPPPQVRLYVGDRDTPAPHPRQLGSYGMADPTALGLRVVYDGLARTRRST